MTMTTMPVPSTRMRMARAGVAGTLSCALIGCYVPAPVEHVVLTVLASGAFELAGQPMAADRLQAAISTRQAAAPKLVVEIRVAPEVPMLRVHEAVKLIESAHARVSFAGNAQVLHGGTVTIPEAAYAKPPVHRASGVAAAPP